MITDNRQPAKLAASLLLILCRVSENGAVGFLIAQPLPLPGEAALLLCTEVRSE